MSVELGPNNYTELVQLLLRGFLPATFLIFGVLGSNIFGWATPTEASGVGPAGAILLAAMNRRLTFKVLRTVVEHSMLTNAMLFFIFIGATAFSRNCHVAAKTITQLTVVKERILPDCVRNM